MRVSWLPPVRAHWQEMERCIALRNVGKPQGPDDGTLGCDPRRALQSEVQEIGRVLQQGTPICGRAAFSERHDETLQGSFVWASTRSCGGWSTRRIMGTEFWKEI